MGTTSLIQKYSWYSTVFVKHTAINRALTLYLWAVACELCRNPALFIYSMPVLWVSMYSYPRHDSQSHEYFICFQHNSVIGHYLCCQLLCWYLMKGHLCLVAIFQLPRCCRGDMPVEGSGAWPIIFHLNQIRQAFSAKKCSIYFPTPFICISHVSNVTPGERESERDSLLVGLLFYNMQWKVILADRGTINCTTQMHNSTVICNSRPS